jgi:hypothetical protein
MDVMQWLYPKYNVNSDGEIQGIKNAQTINKSYMITRALNCKQKAYHPQGQVQRCQPRVIPQNCKTVNFLCYKKALHFVEIYCNLAPVKRELAVSTLLTGFHNFASLNFQDHNIIIENKPDVANSA